MANPRFDANNIISFLEDEDTEGVDLWDIVFESGKSTTHYDVEGLRQVKCMERSICSTTRNIIQISTRRRVMTGSMEGRFALSQEDIERAENAQRSQWEKMARTVKVEIFLLRPISDFFPSGSPCW